MTPRHLLGAHLGSPTGREPTAPRKSRVLRANTAGFGPSSIVPSASPRKTTVKKIPGNSEDFDR